MKTAEPIDFDMLWHKFRETNSFGTPIEFAYNIWNAAVDACADSARTTDPRNFIKVKTDSI